MENERKPGLPKLDSIDRVNEIWKEDLLNRKEEADFLQGFLVRRSDERRIAGESGSYVLNINAPWGKGKSFFLERFVKQLKESNYIVANVNAWQDDHADDPLLSVMAGIKAAIGDDSTVAQNTKKIVKGLAAVSGQIVAAGAKGIVKQAAKRYLGEEAEEIGRLIGSTGGSANEAVTDASKAFDKLWDKKAEALIDDFEKQKETIESFKRKLVSFSSGLNEKGPLFIVIDELDRCRPTYAIGLLERVKHLFDVSGIIFVVATDTEQLRHAIGAVYGVNFDSTRYLFRFFDQSYNLRTPSQVAFVESLIDKLTIDEKVVRTLPQTSVGEFILSTIEACGLSLRDAKQCIDVFQTVLTVWPYKTAIELAVMFPLIVLHQQGIVIGELQLASTALRDLSTKNRGKIDHWKFEFENFNFRSTALPITVSGISLFDEYAKRAGKSLAEQPDFSGPMQEWVAFCFRVEFATLHGNTFQRDRMPFSILLKYAALVENAGRLSSADLG